MERKFTIKQKIILRNLCNRNKEITITGLNSFGEHFLTKGKVVEIRNDLIMLEFAKGKSEDYKGWVAPFALNLKYGDKSPAFIIEAIYDHKGKQMYVAENFDDIVDVAKNNKKYFFLQNSKYKFKLLDPVTSELKKLVAQPIFLKNKLADYWGVLEKVKCVDEVGYPIIEIFNGTESEIVKVQNNTMLYILDRNGEESLKVQNDPKIFEIARENNKPINTEKTM